MNKLYSDDPIVREEEAAKYRVFHKKVRISSKWRNDWRELLGERDVNSGMDWPKDLLRLMKSRKWPEFSFGTANASCLVVMHRPGDPNVNLVEDKFVAPGLPVLGGIPHAHNEFWYPRYSTSQTYRSLHRYLKLAFSRLKNPWSQVMTTNLTTIPASTGQTDSQANLRAVNNGLLDFMVTLCQPRVILLCGGEVHKAAASWNPPSHAEVVECTHPSYQHWSGVGDRVKDTIESVLFP